MALILKIQHQDEIYRVRLEQQRAVQLEDLDVAIQKFLPGLSTRDFKYADFEGDLCTLCEATLPDFLAEAESGRAALKLVFTPAAPALAPPREGQAELGAPAGAEDPAAQPPVAGEPGRDAPVLDASPVVGQPELGAPGAPPTAPAAEAATAAADEPPVAGPPEAGPVTVEPPRAAEVANGADEPSMAEQPECSRRQRGEQPRGPLRPVHHLLRQVFGPVHQALGRAHHGRPRPARVLHLRGPHGARPRSCRSTQGLAVCEIAALLRQDLGLQGSVHDVIREASALLGVQTPTRGGLKMQADLCYQKIYGEAPPAPPQGPGPVPATEAKPSIRAALKHLAVAAKELQDQGALSVATFQALLLESLPDLAQACTERQAQLNACGPWLRARLLPLLGRARGLFDALEELQLLQPLVEEYVSGTDVGCLGDFLAPALAALALRTEDPAVQEGLLGVAEELLPALQRRLARHECFRKGFGKGCFWKGFGKGFAAGQAKEGGKCQGKGTGKCKGRFADTLHPKDSSLPPTDPASEVQQTDTGAFQREEQAGTELPNDLAGTGEENFLMDMGLCESAEEAREALSWYGGDVLATVEGLTSSDSSE